MDGLHEAARTAGGTAVAWHFESDAEGRAAAGGADEILERMALLVDSEGALLVRTAEVLAMLGDFDERLLGYTQFRALLENEVDLDRSYCFRLRDLIRSGLTDVLIAVVRNRIAMSDAFEAPRGMTREEQLAWIEGVRSGELKRKRRAKGARRVRVNVEDPKDAEIVHEATKRARTIRGGNCTDQRAQQDILDAFRARADGKAIIRKATARRERPPERPPIDWSTMPDVAAELLGPRVVARDAHHARELLKQTLFQYRMRTIELGLLYEQVVDGKLYRRWSFDSVEEMVRESFTVCVKTLQNYRTRARDLSIYPELLDALRGGMDFARVMAICDVATEDNVSRWLAVAKRTTVMEIRRAVQWAIETEGERVLCAYEAAIARTKGAHQWVALRAAKRPAKPPRWIEGVDPELVEACRWYLAHVRIPKQHGFQEVKEREDWVCENPRCYCRTIRSEGHHAIWQCRGGSDDPRNARDLCMPCHLRGIHPFEVVRLDVEANGTDLWSYADGPQIVVY